MLIVLYYLHIVHFDLPMQNTTDVYIYIVLLCFLTIQVINPHGTDVLQECFLLVSKQLYYYYYYYYYILECTRATYKTSNRDCSP